MPTDTYHHGDLKQALLTAAEGLLLEKGVEAFTLRECARRAGVSHAAPAHHFGDAKGLLTSFATIGFERLNERQTQYRLQAEDTPQAQVVALGRAYIDFALQSPAHFRLMFGQGRIDLSEPRLHAASFAAGKQLVDVMLSLSSTGNASPESLEPRIKLAWSVVHGYANLAIDGRFDTPFSSNSEEVKARSAEIVQHLPARNADAELVLTMLVRALEN